MWYYIVFFLGVSMHILTDEEEQLLFCSRRQYIQNKAYQFIKKNSGTKRSFFQIYRLFLLAENYDAESEIPFDEVKKNLNNLSALKKLVHDFRVKIGVYDESIHKIVQKGMKIRKSYQPVYPAFFDKKERVYLKIDPVSSGLLHVKNVLDEINRHLPENMHLKAVQVDNSLLIQYPKDRACKNAVLGTKAGRFFKKQADYAGQILNRLQLSDNISDFVRFINSVKHYNDYYSAHTKFKQFSPIKIPRALITPVLFYSLKSKNTELTEQSLVSCLKDIQDFYLKKYQNFHLMQAVHRGDKQKEATVDMLVLSKVPSDIAKMSAYAEYSKNEWGSCMVPTGVNAHYLPYEIGKGVFVVFCVNSNNPAKKLARISVKPYLNENGDVYYGAGYMYGLRAPEVKEKLECFLSDYQPKLVGAFTIDKEVYIDATTKTYYFNMDEYDILKHQNLEPYEGVSGRLGVGNYQRNIVSMIDKIENLFKFGVFDSRPVLSVDTEGLNKGVSFSNMDIYGIFECYNLTKEKATFLPYHADELSLTSSNLHDFKGINMRYFSLQMHLGNNLRSLEGLSEHCSEVSFIRTHINAPVFRIPKQVKKLNMGLSRLSVEEFDLSGSRDVIDICEENFKSVKRLILPTTAKAFNFHFSTIGDNLSLKVGDIKKFNFSPLTQVKLKDFKLESPIDKFTLCNVVLPECELDLSQSSDVFMGFVSLQNVKKLILPKNGQVKFSNCEFPNGLTTDVVIRNHGFGHKNKKPEHIKMQNSQKGIHLLRAQNNYQNG